MNALRMVLPGAPRTKKTSNWHLEVGRRCRLCLRGQYTKTMPSKTWQDWCDRLVPMIKAALPADWVPIAFAVNCEALFFQDVDRADSHGLYQGLADVLQHAGVVKNDRLIKTWDRSLPLVDAASPRVEFVLTRFVLTRKDAP